VAISLISGPQLCERNKTAGLPGTVNGKTSAEGGTERSVGASGSAHCTAEALRSLDQFLVPFVFASLPGVCIAPLRSVAVHRGNSCNAAP